MSTHAQLVTQSAALRAARAQVRSGLRDGTLDIETILMDPPESIAKMTVFDVLRMLRHTRSANRWEQRLGREALAAGINVHVRVGEASLRTLCWAVDHGQWCVRHWRGEAVPA